MSPSALSVAVAASLVALVSCGIGGGAAYVAAYMPPSLAPRHYGRSRVSTTASAAASYFDSDITGGSDGIDRNEPRSPLAPLANPSSLPYIRIQKRGRHYNVQTAITTFRKTTGGSDGDNDEPATTTIVDLHAQIHFGDASYFRYFDDDAAFGSRYDRVLYELIVEDRFLTQSHKGKPGLRRLMPASPNSGENPIAPTEADRSTALQYGLQCQVDAIRYCRENWIHADLTREEFVARLECTRQRQQHQSRPGSANGRDAQQPLWALASTAATYPGSELVTSLTRPLTTASSSASEALTRRLFTHLFLPGDALSGWIRAALWFGVPSPELSIMLVDWSSLSHVGRRSRRRGLQRDAGDDGIGPVSPIAAPVLLSLLAGSWGTARRLVFGQVLAGGQFGADGSEGGVLIGGRNERAMDVLRDSLSSPGGGGDGGPGRVALLYGAGHCRDLRRRLVGEEGMTPVRTEWRTAFRATVPRWGDLVGADDRGARTDGATAEEPEGVVASVSASTMESAAVGLVVLPLYLLVGALDWVSTVGDLGNALEGGRYLDGIASALLYLATHVALYVGISKFVVDWGGNEGIFEDDETA